MAMSELFRNIRKIYANTFDVPEKDMASSNLPHVFTVHHAFAGFADLLKAGGEEIRSAAFMGLWAATVGFYNFMSALDQLGPQKTLWHAPEKHDEGVLGADFGIAFQVSRELDGSTEHCYRLAYFQAKNNSVKKGEGGVSLDIGQISGDTSSNVQQREQALIQLENWIKCTGSEKNYSFDPKSKVEFQVYGLGRTDAGLDWTHYVIWDDNDTTTVQLSEVRRLLVHKGIQSTKGKRLSTTTSPMKINTNPARPDENMLEEVSLKNLLLRAVEVEHSGWREVRVDEAADLIASFTQLGSAWYIEKDGGDDGGLGEMLKGRLARPLEEVNPVKPVADFVAETSQLFAKLNVKPVAKTPYTL